MPKIPTHPKLLTAEERRCRHPGCRRDFLTDGLCAQHYLEELSRVEKRPKRGTIRFGSGDYRKVAG
jgi:hypothetical protein